MSATVVGRDPPTDVAVLRVDAKGLASLPLGDSDAARVGDWVVAIGNPFGLQHTVSAGILSAKGRTSQDVKGLDESGYYKFLQTDASINPGNSGGPLLDTGGRVVGINTAIRAEANSIGFAIPVNMVRDLLPRLLKDGEIKRSAVGVQVSSVLPDDVARLGLAVALGALVRVVVPGGPADVAGLEVERRDHGVRQQADQRPRAPALARELGRYRQRSRAEGGARHAAIRAPGEARGTAVSAANAPRFALSLSVGVLAEPPAARRGPVP